MTSAAKEKEIEIQLLYGQRESQRKISIQKAMSTRKRKKVVYDRNPFLELETV